VSENKLDDGDVTSEITAVVGIELFFWRVGVGATSHKSPLWLPVLKEEDHGGNYSGTYGEIGSNDPLNQPNLKPCHINTEQGRFLFGCQVLDQLLKGDDCPRIRVQGSHNLVLVHFAHLPQGYIFNIQKENLCSWDRRVTVSSVRSKIRYGVSYG
jgi:hypothetical protein